MAATESSIELAAAIEASPIKLFAFDFDLTLTNVHVYNSGVKVTDVPKRFEVDVPCRHELAAVLSAIDAASVNSEGNQTRSWCVVTFGQPPVVSAYLAALGFPNADVRSPLEGSQCYGEVSGIRPPPDKNAFLAALASEKGLSNGEVALFDDDQRNVRTAIAAGFMGSAVSPGEGMSTEAFLWHLEKAVNRKT